MPTIIFHKKGSKLCQIFPQKLFSDSIIHYLKNTLTPQKFVFVNILKICVCFKLNLNIVNTFLVSTFDENKENDEQLQTKSLVNISEHYLEEIGNKDSASKDFCETSSVILRNNHYSKKPKFAVFKKLHIVLRCFFSSKL